MKLWAARDLIQPSIPQAVREFLSRSISDPSRLGYVCSSVRVVYDWHVLSYWRGDALTCMWV